MDLNTAAIRPAQSEAWFATLKQRIMDASAATQAKVRVLTGTWQHDLDQVNILPCVPRKPPVRRGQVAPPPERGLFIDVQPVGSHRLALALDQQGKLLPLVQHAVMGELGIQPPPVRVTNLL